MSANAEFVARRQAATPRGVAVMCDFFVDRAENAEIWDIEGRRYIDFGAGIAVLNTGHRQPQVIAAIESQLSRFTHTAYQVTPYESYVALAERLNALVPGDWPKKTALFTTGVEAVENAVKIARAATGRSAVVAFAGGFHGRTLMGMALTGKVAPYKTGFGPMPGEVFHAPYPNELDGISVAEALRGVRQLFKVAVDPARVAAILVEPVQGEGGFYIAPPEFLQGLRKLCDEHGILLIADEIQTGFCRTGAMFAMQHSGVAADLVTLAKSLGGGMPLSAVCGRAEVMDAPPPGGLGSTYAGNPLSVAAAHAVLDVLEAADLAGRARTLGARLVTQLQECARRVPQIAEVRGLGAMVAVEFRQSDGQPDPAFTQAVRRRALARGLLLLTCGTEGNVIRFLFPLTIPEAVFEEGLAVLRAALLEAHEAAGAG